MLNSLVLYKHVGLPPPLCWYFLFHLLLCVTINYLKTKTFCS